jgi:Ca2+-binding RTX toxin-like protein
MNRRTILPALALLATTGAFLVPATAASAAVPTCNNMPATVPGVIGTDGPDVIVGTDAADTIRGLGGNDVICGGAGGDIIVDGPGNDTDFGEGGNDFFVADAAATDGADSWFGGDGLDLADYENRLAGITLKMDNVANDGVPGELDNVHTDVENIRGTQGPDRITGSAARDFVLAGNGDDNIDGLGGDDTLDGQNGNDRINGGDGNDSFPTSPGNDIMSGGNGNDSYGTNNPVDGSDSFQGGPGEDTASYNRTGGQSLNLDGLANDGLPGENDRIGADVEDISGGSGGDLIVGSAANNFLQGQDGADRVIGGLGADVLDGGPGDGDVVDGVDGLANDLVAGGLGVNDTCLTDPGDITNNCEN